MRKRVLVTGAGGYIGRHVVRALCDLDAEVWALDLHAFETDRRAKKIIADVFNGSKTVFQDLGCPDAVLHAAWQDGFAHNSTAHMSNLSSHYILIQNLVDGGLKQLAVMGTMHEVGYYEGSIDENTPCNPVSLYGIAKDALRRSAFETVKDKDTCLQWIRAYYIYGDDSRNHSIFTKLLEAEAMGKQTFPFTSGRNRYDFITVEDLAHQIAATLMQREVRGIINCCSGEPVSLAEKVESFIKEHNLRIRLDYGAFPDRAYDSPCVWGDNAKIRRVMEMSQ